jgi:hypothetical protein
MITLDRLDKAISRTEQDIARIPIDEQVNTNKIFNSLVDMLNMFQTFRRQAVRLDKLMVALGV